MPRRTFDSLEQAKKFRHDLDSQLGGGAAVTNAGSTTLLSEFAEGWRRTKRHGRQSADTLESRLRLHVYPTFGERPLNSLTQVEVETWAEALEEDLAPATVKALIDLLAAIYRQAIQDELVFESPVDGVKRPDVEQDLLEPISPQQVRAIEETIAPPFRAAIRLDASTGLTRGELFGLTVDRIVMIRRRLVVDQHLQYPQEGRPPRLVPLPGGPRVREVPLPQAALTAVVDHLDRFGSGDDGLVFTSIPTRQTRPGLPVDHKRFSRAWRPAATAAGLGPGQGLLELRHHYVHQQFLADVDPAIVMRRIGAASPHSFLRTYGHLIPANTVLSFPGRRDG